MAEHYYSTACYFKEDKFEKCKCQALHIKRIKWYSKNTGENGHFYLVRKAQGLIVNYKLQFVIWKTVYMSRLVYVIG